MESERRILAIMLLVILVASIILIMVQVNPHQRGTEYTETNSTKQSISGETIACEATWTKGLVVASDPDLGNVYYVLPSSNDKNITIYKTSVFYLISEKKIPENETITGLAKDLSNITLLNFIEEKARENLPTVVASSVSPKDGYEIFLPEGKPPACLRPALNIMYPGKGDEIKAKFVGYSIVPYRVPGWAYYNVSLPAWALSLNGENVSMIWIDPSRGLLVAELDRFGLHIWSMIVAPLPG